MGLGNNRDYKSTDRRVRANLARHSKRMDELIAQGRTRDEASHDALREMFGAEADYLITAGLDDIGDK